jgi:hypothetical protein
MQVSTVVPVTSNAAPLVGSIDWLGGYLVVLPWLARPGWGLISPAIVKSSLSCSALFKTTEAGEPHAEAHEPPITSIEGHLLGSIASLGL